jgi:predicted nuclease of predicted toxin-antitoxin system
MKLLIDENLPKALKQYLSEYDVYTVRDMGWQGKKNGELMALMLAEQFEVLITFDKNLQHQQNFERYPVAVLVLNAFGNSILFLTPLIAPMCEAVKRKLPPGATVISLSTSAPQ